MIDYLLHLPYIGFWLPIAAAIVAAGPLLWLMRPSRERVQPPAETPPEVAPTPHAAEQRRSFRRGGHSIDVFYKHPQQQGGPAQASVHDRSMGGVCLLTHETLAVGTVLSIRPAQADEIVPWVDVEVCTCRQVDDCFEVGCRFIKTPPYSILLLFG
jgi:hypothetical protein